MELESHITAIFDPSIILPAIGQGAIGIQCRRDDQRTFTLLSAINHADSYDCVQAERGVMVKLDGSCRTPIAALAQIIDREQLTMEALIANPDGSSLLRHAITGKRNEAHELGLALGQQLLDQGGDKMLNLITR